MTTLRYDQAAALAIADELGAGRQLVVLRIAGSGSAPDEMDEVLAAIGEGRLRADTDPSLLAVVAAGAAFAGVRPVLDLVYTGTAAADLGRIARELAERPPVAPGSVPPTFARVVAGAGAAGRPDPALEAERAFVGVPGVKIAVPATVARCYGLVRAALADDGPVVVVERAGLGALVADISADSAALAVGRSVTARRGDRLSIVVSPALYEVVLEAAARLCDEDGIEAEVLDPCWLVPFDDDGVATSLEKTAKLLVVHEASLDASFAAPLVTRLVAEHLYLFDAPPRLLGPNELAAHQAEAVPGRGPGRAGQLAARLPGVEDVLAAARELAAY